MITTEIPASSDRVQIWYQTAPGQWEHEMTCPLADILLDNEEDPEVIAAIGKLVARVATEVYLGGGAAPFTRLTLETP